MSSYVSLRGSHREHPVGLVPVGKPASGENLQITLILRRRNIAPDSNSIEHPLSHEQLAQLHGADPADITAIEAFASEHQVSIVAVEPAARSITLSGRFSAMAAAFGADVELRRMAENGKVIRTRRGYLHLPGALAECVIAVLGFDQRPAAKTHHRVSSHDAQPVSYTPLQLARIYNFPTNSGTNQTIALIELGGGFNNSDLKAYWRQLGLNNVSVTAVSVDGG